MEQSKFTLRKDLIKINLILSGLFLIAGLLSLIWLNDILYGILVGFVAIIITEILILLIYKFKFIQNNLQLYSWTRWIFRVGFGVGYFCLIIFLFNPLLLPNNEIVIKLIQEPINAFGYLFTYTIPVLAVFFLPLYERIKNKK